MSWAPEGLNPSDRVVQAGVVLVEQALFADAMNFPASMSGTMKLPDANGKIEITAPNLHEFVNSQRQHDQTTTEAFHEDLDAVTDTNGRVLSTTDEREQQDAAVLSVTNKFDCDTLIRNADGSVQQELKGKSVAFTVNGNFRDDSYILFDSNQQQQPVRLELAGQVMNGATSQIKATTVVADEKGEAVLGADGKPQILTTIELAMQQDPDDPGSVKFEFRKNAST